MAFDFGARVSGSSTSTATQDASVQFIPSVTGSGAQPWVSPYPAGQGLATINTALPGSAAYRSSTYAGIAGASSSSSLTTLIVLAGIGLAAWWLLRKGRR